MITQLDILNAINSEIVNADSGAKAVYKQFCPKDFERPSHFIEALNYSVEPANCFTVKITASFFITSFVEVDERYISSADDLLGMQEKVMNIFRKGYIQVGDRALTITSKTTDDGEAVLTEINLEFYDDKITTDEEQPIENINLNLTEVD